MTLPGLVAAQNLADVADRERAWDNLGLNISFSFPSWTPAQITTTLWLDAADTSTITTIGGAVSQWNDKSGNERNVTQGVAGNRPLLMLNAQNGLSGIKFDGGDDFMQTAANFPLVGNPAFSVFTAHRRGASLAQRLGWGINDTVAGATVLGVSFAFLGANNFNAATSPAPNTAYQFGYVKTPGAINTTSNLYLNGNNNNGSGHSTLTPNIYTGSSFVVGRLGPITNLFDDGTLLEVLIIPSAVSVGIRQNIEGYLAHKWGLTANLPGDHPYRTVPPAP